MPLTMEDQMLIARTLTSLLRAKGWTHTAEKFAALEMRLRNEERDAAIDDANDGRMPVIGRAVAIPASHPCPHADECVTTGRECPCAAMGR